MRIRQIGPIQQKRLMTLVSIKNDLFRCRNNVLTVTKAEMKALRRKLYDIKNENVGLTGKENEVSTMLLYFRCVASNSNG